MKGMSAQYWSAGHPLKKNGVLDPDCSAITGAKWTENWVNVECSLKLMFACSKACSSLDPLEWSVENFTRHSSVVAGSGTDGSAKFCAKIPHLPAKRAGLIGSRFVMHERDAVVLDISSIRSVAGVLMQASQVM